MKSKIYNIANIGDIQVCKHHSTKRLAIKLKQGAIPKVIIPSLMTYEMGYRFALEKQGWILEHTKKLSQSLKKPVFDLQHGFKTRFQEIEIKNHNKKNIITQKTNNLITIFVPSFEEVGSDKIQQSIKSIITEIMRFEAKKYLVPRTKELAEKKGFGYTKVYIKNLKSRWGSCSAANNINLNLHLMRLPEYLSDFIILHELCHTVYKNHGKQFHDLLNNLVGDEKALNKELKNYSSQL